MIILRHVDLNYFGDYQLLNKAKYIFILLICLSSFSQNADYEQYLRFLPESVRSSVESRLSGDIQDESNYDEINKFQSNLSLETLDLDEKKLD